MLNHKNISILFSAVFIVLCALNMIVNVHLVLFLLLFIFWIGITTWGVFDIRSQYFTKTYCNNSATKERTIALSFDDGPHEMTPLVLSTLEKYNAKATFFCIGSHITKYPEIFKQIDKGGHIIGNHSYSHSNYFSMLSTDKMMVELIDTRNLIRELIGKETLYFRPPFGVTNPNLARAVLKTEFKTIGWNIRSLDTVINSEEEIFERIKKRITPGGIILLHDTSFKTVNVLERLLLFLQEEKYNIVSIEQIINESPYVHKTN